MTEMRLQYVWHWNWYFGFKRMEGGLATIYRWVVRIGPLEIRRWRLNRSEYDEIKRHNLATRTTRAERG